MTRKTGYAPKTAREAVKPEVAVRAGESLHAQHQGRDPKEIDATERVLMAYARPGWAWAQRDQEEDETPSRQPMEYGPHGWVQGPRR